MVTSRNEVVKIAQSWIGLNETDGSYKKIIDIYNSYKGKFPRGIKMQYGWSWCCCTWSAIAIHLGYTNVMPIEISCGEIINRAKDMGVWVEKDSYRPKPADAVLYDWDDSGKGDNTGWPDHIGIVEKVFDNYFVVIEGNYKDSVKRRTVSIDGKYIRGFITPKYDKDDAVVQTQKPNTGNSTNYKIAVEVISGEWGNGDARKYALEKAGYDYEEIRKLVNYILNERNVATPGSASSADQDQPVQKLVVATTKPKVTNSSVKGRYKTTANLYCRYGAGTNMKAMCLIPKGTKVKCDGSYTIVNKTKWYYISVIIDRVEYRGFSCSDYLKEL